MIESVFNCLTSNLSDFLTKSCNSDCVINHNMLFATAATTNVQNYLQLKYIQYKRDARKSLKG